MLLITHTQEIFLSYLKPSLAIVIKTYFFCFSCSCLKAAGKRKVFNNVLHYALIIIPVYEIIFTLSSLPVLLLMPLCICNINSRELHYEEGA